MLTGGAKRWSGVASIASSTAGLGGVAQWSQRFTRVNGRPQGVGVVWRSGDVRRRLIPPEDGITEDGSGGFFSVCACRAR